MTLDFLPSAQISSIQLKFLVRTIGELDPFLLLLVPLPTLFLSCQHSPD